MSSCWSRTKIKQIKIYIYMAKKNLISQYKLYIIYGRRVYPSQADVIDGRSWHNLSIVSGRVFARQLAGYGVAVSLHVHSQVRRFVLDSDDNVPVYFLLKVRRERQTQLLTGTYRQTCTKNTSSSLSLPLHIRSSDSLVTFQSRLKSHFFSSAYHV